MRKTEKTCIGCGRSLAETGTRREHIGRRHSNRYGWHNATARACDWCGAHQRWDRPGFNHPRHSIPTTIEEVKDYNREAGLFFFEPATMRAFRSRVADGVTIIGGLPYFITSEQQTPDYVARIFPAREYTIRYQVPGGDIRREGELGAYETLRQARAALARMAEAATA